MALRRGSQESPFLYTKDYSVVIAPCHPIQLEQRGQDIALGKQYLVLVLGQMMELGVEGPTAR